MTYSKAVLEVQFFDVEDVITTSGASATTGAGNVLTPPTPAPTPKPAPPAPDPEPDPNDLI